MPDDKVKRREQAKIRIAMKQREYKRLRMAQSVQRELEEVAVKQAELEQEGVVVEKALRSGNSEFAHSSFSCICLVKAPSHNKFANSCVSQQHLTIRLANSWRQTEQVFIFADFFSSIFTLALGF